MCCSGSIVVRQSFWRQVLAGLGWVLLILLAVGLLLLVDALLLIPGLLLAYGAVGLSWRWQGVIPDPVHIPGPWLSMAVGIIATALPAVADGLLLQVFLGQRHRP
uniref:AI-2E family transporter n=1 Tax=Acidithiobacillus sulfuriphilus TaxID=1867749 RepID=A0A3M8RH99_9PROT|nr:hypothetical protein EC580_03865 [Acidithiobacillus sulfuriphilus]